MLGSLVGGAMVDGARGAAWVVRPCPPGVYVLPNGCLAAAALCASIVVFTFASRCIALKGCCP